ncbi:phage shock envelope stress response protein PspM [Antrihabitans cavernicola]|uniref:phage shock envelope stress response protein PspM n=1 Tax=Antrihabitans cavernicola TaxID=2495913 RepID=UPI001659EB0C|nr:hypothetical protein [Spelaeibacter cavernicola]
MLREVGESMLVAVAHWAQPRERELRKRRRARRRSIRYSAATGVTAVGTAGLVAVAAPVWAIVATGGGAAVLVVPAALAIRKYRRLRSKPLPEPVARKRAVPPLLSSARAPMLRLVRAERSLHELLAVIARSSPVPDDELAETDETARSAAAALHALAADIVAMERAGRSAGAVAADLDAAVAAAVAQLESGVSEYEELLAAAARMTVPVAAAPRSAIEAASMEMRYAADRLDGWAEGLAELAGPPLPSPLPVTPRVPAPGKRASGSGSELVADSG